ncbi:hypothetical protein GCM10025791_44930 [Halioxenophilus aromaticivorans]|uniref:Uncharacterized protein n=2 Tax=Halioxenophilus aromaticivorans TaxID=1306992 RepID=A0AAV3U923_9ALTE
MTVGGLLCSSHASIAEPDATASSLNRFLAYEQQLSVPQLGFAPLPSPFAVGIALVPTGAAFGSIHYQDQVALLEAVQANLDGANFISRTEILPMHSVQKCQHFVCFAQLAKQFNVHAIALVSYDQIIFPSQRTSDGQTKTQQTAYLMRLDQQITIAGAANEVHTSINASLFNASSQQLLLSASGAQVGKPKLDVPPGENAEPLNFTQAKSTLLQDLADGLARSEDHLQPEPSVPLLEPPPVITEDFDATPAPGYAGLQPLSSVSAAIPTSTSAISEDASDSPVLVSSEAAGGSQAGLTEVVPAPLISSQHSDSTAPVKPLETKTTPGIPAQVDIGISKADGSKNGTPAPLRVGDSNTPASRATSLPSQTASAQTTFKPVATKAAIPSQATAGKVGPPETDQRQYTGSAKVDAPSLSNPRSRDSGLSHSSSTNPSSTRPSSTNPGTSPSTHTYSSRPDHIGAIEPPPVVGSAKHSPSLAPSATVSPLATAHAESTAPLLQDLPAETVETANNGAEASMATSSDSVLETKQLPSKESKRGAGSTSLMWLAGLLLFSMRRQRRTNIRRL